MVHGIHLEKPEIEKIAESSTWLTHQPRSNMNNAVGVAPIETMMNMGVKVCMGNDGFSNAMWEEWKTAYLLHKINSRDPRAMNGNDVIKIAVYNNADLATQIFDSVRIGEISIGAAADLILVDYKEITPLNPDNLPWHILFGFRDSMVTTTIVNGQILMQDRELKTLDEEELTKKALENASKLWKLIK
jgi:cytosine/adenosine deaminase-related metal-dependent hydrolase